MLKKKHITRWWQLKYVLFSPRSLLGEMIQFDEHIFQMGWFNHHLAKKTCHSIFRGEIEFKRGLNRRGKFKFNPLLNSISPSHPIQVQSGRWPSGRKTLYDLVPNVLTEIPCMELKQESTPQKKKMDEFPWNIWRDIVLEKKKYI